MRQRILVSLLAAWPALAGSPAGVSDRGVVLLQKPGSASYRILLQRGGQMAEVPDRYEFQSGDQFAVKLNLTRGGYVYVLNRTLNGSPDRLQAATRGNALMSTATVAQEQQALAAAHATATELVAIYPAEGHKRVGAGWVTVPSGGMLQMDNEPGMEKVYIVVSPRPETSLRGLLARLTGTGNKGPRAEVEQEIRTTMAEMASNTEVAGPPIPARGLQFVPASPAERLSLDHGPAGGSKPPAVAGGRRPPAAASAAKPNIGVAAPLTAQKPYLIELTLIHR